MPKPSIEGLVADSYLIPADQLWSDAFRAQRYVYRRIELRNRQRIIIPNQGQPFALAFLSDLHLGDANTDYRQAKKDAETIRDTPRMFAMYHGDGINNWINRKLMHLQRNEALPFDGEVQLLYSWLDLLRGKLLVSVAGNHDNWTNILSGFDLIRNALRSTTTLYDPHEVVFDLVWGKLSWKVKVRHSYRYSSIFNITHGIETNWERGGVPFDIGIGGHTHISTVCRPFIRQNKKRFALLTGTYKTSDDFGRALGFAPPVDRGCGAMIFSRDGLLFCENLLIASSYLGYLLGKTKGGARRKTA